jgi:hypothetical protein
MRGFYNAGARDRSEQWVTLRPRPTRDIGAAKAQSARRPRAWVNMRIEHGAAARSINELLAIFMRQGALEAAARRASFGVTGRTASIRVPLSPANSAAIPTP